MNFAQYVLSAKIEKDKKCAQASNVLFLQYGYCHVVLQTDQNVQKVYFSEVVRLSKYYEKASHYF